MSEDNEHNIIMRRNERDGEDWGREGERLECRSTCSGKG